MFNTTLKKIVFFLWEVFTFVMSSIILLMYFIIAISARTIKIPCRLCKRVEYYLKDQFLLARAQDTQNKFKPFLFTKKTADLLLKIRKLTCIFLYIVFFIWWLNSTVHFNLLLPHYVIYTNSLIDYYWTKLSNHLFHFQLTYLFKWNFFKNYTPTSFFFYNEVYKIIITNIYILFEIFKFLLSIFYMYYFTFNELICIALTGWFLNTFDAIWFCFVEFEAFLFINIITPMFYWTAVRDAIFQLLLEVHEPEIEKFNTLTQVVLYEAINKICYCFYNNFSKQINHFLFLLKNSPIFIIVLNVIIIILFILIGGIIPLIERKYLSLIQRRVGPKFVGYNGRLQFIADALKLLFKEIIFLINTNKFMFVLLPILLLNLNIFLLINLVWLNNLSYIDNEYFILLILIIELFTSICTAYIGFLVKNKYTIIASTRVLNGIIVFEIFLITLYFYLYILHSKLSLDNVYFNQIFNIKLKLNLVILPPIIYAVLLNLKKVPFDIIEAETELIMGFTTEHSGFLGAALLLIEYLHLFLWSFLILTLFII